MVFLITYNGIMYEHVANLLQLAQHDNNYTVLDEEPREIQISI